MKLAKTTRINSIIFQDNNHNDIRVCSFNLNMTFGEYLNKCKKPLYNGNGSIGIVPKSINKMLSFNFSFVSTETKGDYTFTLYKFTDKRFSVSFIELS